MLTITRPLLTKNEVSIGLGSRKI